MSQAKSSETKLAPASFLVFPLVALDYLVEKKINITDLAVLNVLCKYRSNKTSMCRPSQTTIGERIHRSRSTVSKSIKKLVQCGLVKIVAKANSREHRTTVYQIMFPLPSDGVHGKEGTITTSKFNLEYFLEESRKKRDELFAEHGV